MSFVKRLRLEQNWPLLVAGGAGLVAIALFFYVRNAYASIAPTYYFENGEIVDYWALLSQHQSLNAPFSGLLVFGLVLLGIIVSWIAVAHSRSNRLVTTGLAISANIGLLFVCAGSFAPSLVDGTVLRHIESLEFRDRVYHLTLANIRGGGADWVESHYVLYECDSLGELCRPIHWLLNANYYGRSEGEAALAVDLINDQLNLQIGGETVYTVQATEAPNVVQ